MSELKSVFWSWHHFLGLVLLLKIQGRGKVHVLTFAPQPKALDNAQEKVLSIMKGYPVWLMEPPGPHPW
jgi:hypothetical protein